MSQVHMETDGMDLVFQHISVYRSYKSGQGDNLSLEDILAHSLLLNQALEVALAYNYFNRKLLGNGYFEFQLFVCKLSCKLHWLHFQLNV